MNDTPRATAGEVEERWSVLHDLEDWLQTLCSVEAHPEDDDDLNS